RPRAFPLVRSLRTAQRETTRQLRRAAFQCAKTENFVAHTLRSDILTISSSYCRSRLSPDGRARKKQQSEGMGYDESRIDGAGPDRRTAPAALGPRTLRRRWPASAFLASRRPRGNDQEGLRNGRCRRDASLRNEQCSLTRPPDPELTEAAE